MNSAQWRADVHLLVLPTRFLLHIDAAGRSSRTPAAARLALLTKRKLLIRIRSPSAGDLRRPFDPGAALGHIRNRHRQMSANRNLAKQRFDRPQFRNRYVIG